MNNVVVTGASIISPLGNSIEDFEKNLFSGELGIHDQRSGWLPSDFPTPFHAKSQHFFTPDFVTTMFSDPSIYTMAVGYLLQSAASKFPNLFCGDTAIDGIIAGYRELNSFQIAIETLRTGVLSEGHLSSLRRETPIELISEFLKAKSIEVPRRNQIVIANACTSGSTAIGYAFEKIKAGDWNRAVVCALEFDPHPLQMMGLFLLGALSREGLDRERASIPFSNERSGFVKGEAAVMLVLESESVAKKRGAFHLGTITGFGHASDGWRLSDGDPEAAGLKRAMRSALLSAQRDPDEVDYINAHGTSTMTGDALEAKAILDVFKARKRPVLVSSLKALLGHPTFACGAIETLASFLMLKQQRVPPNPEVTSDLGLHLVPKNGLQLELRTILNNNSGFGGQNTSLIIER